MYLRRNGVWEVICCRKNQQLISHPDQCRLGNMKVEFVITIRDSFVMNNHLIVELQRIAAYVVIPFGVGARNCPGRKIALQKMYIILIKVFPLHLYPTIHFDFVGKEWISQTPLIPTPDMVYQVIITFFAKWQLAQVIYKK